MAKGKQGRSRIEETLREIEEQHLANLLAKTKEGRPLTSQEFSWVQSKLAAIAGEDRPGGRRADGPEEIELSGEGQAWAKNQTELASILKVSRVRIRRWRLKFKGKAPSKRSDGRESVKEWREFIDREDLLRQQKRERPEPEEDSIEDRRKAEARKIEAQADLLEHQARKARGESIDRMGEAKVWVGLLIRLRNRFIVSANGLATKSAILRKPDKIKHLLLTTYSGIFKHAAKHKFDSFPCPHCKKDVT